jgi:hypothetical protein
MSAGAGARHRGVAEPLNETQSISPYDWVDARGQAQPPPRRPAPREATLSGEARASASPRSARSLTHARDGAGAPRAVPHRDGARRARQARALADRARRRRARLPSLAGPRTRPALVRACCCERRCRRRRAEGLGEQPLKAKVLKAKVRVLQDEIYYETVTAIAPTGGAEGAPGAGEPRKSTFWDLFKRGASGSGSGAGGSLPAVPHTPPASLRAGVLPENVMILTVEKQKDDPQGGFGVLLRVAHRFGIDEDAELSRPATVALSQLFTAAHLAAPKSVEEMSLSVRTRPRLCLARKACAPRSSALRRH